MAWCCESFRLRIYNDIDKGFSFFASKKFEKDVFVLQACPFERDVLFELSKINPETGFTRFSEIKNTK